MLCFASYMCGGKVYFYACLWSFPDNILDELLVVAYYRYCC